MALGTHFGPKFSAGVSGRNTFYCKSEVRALASFGKSGCCPENEKTDRRFARKIDYLCPKNLDPVPKYLDPRFKKLDPRFKKLDPGAQPRARSRSGKTVSEPDLS